MGLPVAGSVAFALVITTCGLAFAAIAALAAQLAAGARSARVLAVLRDHGAGLLPDRPGRAAAAAWLRGPLYWPAGLAWRLQRGTLYGWAAGFAFTFANPGREVL